MSLARPVKRTSVVRMTTAKSQETDMRGTTMVRTMLIPAVIRRRTPIAKATTRAAGSQDPSSASSAHVTPRE
jgi:hypothetical protein